jgi:nickel transport protein
MTGTQKKMRCFGILAFTLILCLALTPAASAHRVHVMGQVDSIQVKAWYGGGAPMTDAEVEIYTIRNGEEELYLTGSTDEEGLFYFTPKLGVSEYKVVASAEGGHRGEEIINLESGAGQEEPEIPLAMRIIAGFGYLTGLAGLGMIMSARKKQKA